MTTAVTRRLDTPTLRTSLVDRAYVFGTDAYVYLDGQREWVVTGKISGSRVSGSAEAVDTLQRAAQRYFQRPDAPHVTLDPTRTSLAGWAGRVNLNRNSGLWQVNAALWGVSPGFESNDLGFLGTGDRAGAHAVVFVPRRDAKSNQPRAIDVGCEGVDMELQPRAAVRQLARPRGDHVPELLEPQRRGPGVAARAGRSVDARWALGRCAWWLLLEHQGQHRLASMVVVRTRTSSGLPTTRVDGATRRRLRQHQALIHGDDLYWPAMETVTSGGAVRDDGDDATAVATHGQRYVFGTIDQTEISMTTRLNLILTPTVSVQVFAQPLLASGDYVNFKELARPRTFDFLTVRQRRALAGFRRGREQLQRRSRWRSRCGVELFLRQSGLQSEVAEAERGIPMGDQVWLELLCRVDAPAGRRARSGPVRVWSRHRATVRSAG